MLQIAAIIILGFLVLALIAGLAFGDLDATWAAPAIVGALATIGGIFVKSPRE
jgi:hypothetical protein